MNTNTFETLSSSANGLREPASQETLMKAVDIALRAQASVNNGDITLGEEMSLRRRLNEIMGDRTFIVNYRGVMLAAN